jgi:regulator of protease activity HflC (stomatin/prohibitin superfamily)
MALRTVITVGLMERVVLLEDGRPVRVLPAGDHVLWGLSRFTALRFSVDAAIDPNMAPAVLELLGKDVVVIDVADDERAVLRERGVAKRRLGPGRHLVWSHNAPTAERYRLDVDEAPLEKLSAAALALLNEDLIIVDVSENERVICLKDSVSTRVLAPGRHGFWRTRNVSVARFDVSAIVADLAPAQAALFADATDDIDVVGSARAIVFRRGKPIRVLSPGRHRVWKHPDISVTMMSFSGVEAVPVDAELRPLLAATDYVEVTVPDGAMGVRFVDGAIDTTLPPGRHAAFCVEQQVSFVSIDLRERVLSVQGQEILSKDRVSLRLNASLSYRVTDVQALVQGAKNVDEILYLAVQLGLREQVAVHTLDEILAERALLTSAIRPALVERAKALGIELVELGVKDVILPGEMKTLLNKVIEAHKSAEANVILRREETAAVRSMAQTAKILEENPVLMRLKELEAYKELADKVGTVNVVVGGGDGGPKLELKI